MSLRRQPDFLIVGLARSGTHWVSALLNAHPEIACFPAMPFRSESAALDKKRVGEVHLFNTLASLEQDADPVIVRPLQNFLTYVHGVFADLVPLASKLPREELYQKFLARYEELCAKMSGGKKLVGESTPMYVFHLAFIDRFYPGIKKICILRDPKDKLVSWHFNDIRKGRKKAGEPVTDKFVQAYLQNVISRELQSLLSYQGEVYCLLYEALSRHTEEAVRDLLNYLEVDYDEKQLDQIIDAASFRRLTAEDSNGKSRRRGEESIKSHYRKGVIGDWENHLTADQAKWIDDASGEKMEEVIKKYSIKLYE